MMKKQLLLVVLLLSVVIANAQTRRITGTVTSQDDKGTLPGVNVKVGETQIGTSTDVNGKYSINVPANSKTLIFSFIGFATQEVPINGQEVINVALVTSNRQLGEVVVTALGISRQEKSLGYAAQQIKGENLTMTRQQDLNTSLAGKVSGVQILGGSGARFGASTIRIRGINSLQGGNPI